MIYLILLMLLPGIAAAQEEDLEARTRAARLRVQAYIAREEWVAAAEALARLTENYPDDRYILADLAMVHQQRGHTDQAVEIYRRLLELYPENQRYRQDLAYLLYETGRYTETVEVLAFLERDLDAADAGLLQVLAESCDRIGRAEKANHLYETLLARDPQDLSNLLLMGERHLAHQQPARARSYFQQARDLQPRNPRALKGLALALGAADQEPYQDYLLQVLVLDKQDPEVPYLLGESHLASDPHRAAKFFQESLRRLEKVDQPNPYQQGLRARLLYRLGQRQQAEEIFRLLLDQNPDDQSRRNDLAEILVDDGRHADALELIPPGIGDTRAAQLRARVYLERREWSRAVGELVFLVEQFPADEYLKLDLAEALERSGDWPGALRIHDEVLRSGRGRPTVERAYEMRRELRAARGGALGLAFNHVGLTDEASFDLGSFLRWPLNSRLQGTVRGTAGLHEDNAILARPDFSKKVGAYGLELGCALLPAWDLSVYGGGYLRHADDRLHLGLKTRYRPNRGGSVEIDGSVNNLWTGPVDAVMYEGLFHQARLSLYLPLAARFALQGQATWRGFRIHRRQDFGDELKGTLVLGREMVRLPYGASIPLRALNLSVAHERSRADQKKAFANLIRLPEETRVTTLNLLAHFLFARRSILNLSPFVGWDPERDLSFGELYGFTGQFHADIRSNVSLDASGFYAAETSVQAQGGSYREARLNLIYYFSSMPTSRYAKLRRESLHGQDSGTGPGRR